MTQTSQNTSQEKPAPAARPKLEVPEYLRETVFETPSLREIVKESGEKLAHSLEGVAAWLGTNYDLSSYVLNPLELKVGSKVALDHPELGGEFSVERISRVNDYGE